MKEKKIRVLLADHHAVVRQGFRLILESQPDIEIIGEAANGRDAVTMSERLQPDIVVMDVGMTELNGIEATRRLASVAPRCRVLALSMHKDAVYVREILKAGARGYLLKRSAASDLKDAIRAVHAGQRYLHPAVADSLVDLVTAGRSGEDAEDEYDRPTPRERQVFTLLAEGKTSRDISKYLSISLKTAMTHRTNVMEKLNMHTRSELIRYAVRKGVIFVNDA